MAQKVELIVLVAQKVELMGHGLVEVVVELIRQRPVHMHQVDDMCPQNVVDYHQFEWAHATVHEKTHGRLHEMVQQKVGVQKKNEDAHQYVELK